MRLVLFTYKDEMQTQMPNESSSLCAKTISVSILTGCFTGVLLADRMMWHQYVAKVGSSGEHIEGATIRASLRRRSHAILVLDNKNGQGAAAVLAKEEKEGSEIGRSSEAKDGDTDDDLGGNEDNKRSFVNSLISVGNTLVLALVGLGYPLAVLPYYRAGSTTE